MKRNEMTFNVLIGSYTGTLVSMDHCKNWSKGVMGSHIEVTECGKMAKNAFFMKKCPFSGADRQAVI